MHFNNKRKSTIAVIIFAIIILVGGYTYCKININKPFHIEINKNDILVQGWWGANINDSDIKSIKLINPPLTVDSQLLGGKLGGKIFGKVYLKNYGKTRCFIENYNGKAIYIKTNLDDYAMNYKNNIKTLQEYNKLKEVNL